VSGARALGSVPPARGAVVVRPVRRDDVARVWELVLELARYERLEPIVTNTPEQLAEFLFEERWPKVECLVAEQAGEIVGYALFFGCYSSFRGKPVIWLEDLCVTEARRGSGAGKALMQALARIAVQRDCARVAWDVLDWNQSSIEFYERLGATRGADWHHYVMDGEALATLGRT
jgi:GNAT superfamily N-acetyltransferase